MRLTATWIDGTTSIFETSYPNRVRERLVMDDIDRMGVRVASRYLGGDGNVVTNPETLVIPPERVRDLCSLSVGSHVVYP